MLLELVSGTANRITLLADRFELEKSIKVLDRRRVILLECVNIAQDQIDLRSLRCQFAGAQGVGLRVG